MPENQLNYNKWSLFSLDLEALKMRFKVKRYKCYQLRFRNVISIEVFAGTGSHGPSCWASTLNPYPTLNGVLGEGLEKRTTEKLVSPVENEKSINPNSKRMTLDVSMSALQTVNRDA